MSRPPIFSDSPLQHLFVFKPLVAAERPPSVPPGTSNKDNKHDETVVKSREESYGEHRVREVASADCCSDGRECRGRHGAKRCRALPHPLPRSLQLLVQPRGVRAGGSPHPARAQTRAAHVSNEGSMI
ncbi:unnamed protein product [Sphagnum jensenii]|uniref:Uncharacterized protein n=1 Tax=Sphagnum jensenii TaxID=128206 RepID=A0ABP0WIE2_9BRYO